MEHAGVFGGIRGAIDFGGIGLLSLAILFKGTDMANHVSALKRIRQSEGRRRINQMNRSQLRGQIRKLNTAIDGGQADEARELLPKTFSLIDKSVQKGIIKANAARRYKSRMNRGVNGIAAA